MNDVRIDIETSANVFETLDMVKDTAVTLNFKSNLLSKLDSITCGVSQTVKVPRTVNNDRILDLAGMPSHESAMTHVKKACRVFVNGIDLIGDAWCHVLKATADNYEVAVTFGLMQNLSTWIDAAYSLRDLDERARDASGAFTSTTDAAVWTAGAANTFWVGGVGYSCYKPSYRWSMYYGSYDCGLTLDSTTRQYCNLHPWVSLREIYERIAAENSLDFTMPSDVLDDMESVGLVLACNNNKTQVRQSATLTANANLKRAYGSFCLAFPASDCFSSHQFLARGVAGVTITPSTSYIYVSGSSAVILGTSRTYEDFVESADVNECLMRITGVSTAITPSKVYSGGRCFLCYVLPSTVSFDYAEEGTAVGSMGIEFEEAAAMEAADVSVSFSGDGFEVYSSTDMTAQPSVIYRYYVDGSSYPTINRFKLVANLPDIKQIEFINYVCNLYGLFATDGGGGNITFVAFDKLDDNIRSAADWSAKLVEADAYGTNPDAMEFTLSAYNAQRNWMRYKEDDKEATGNDDAAYIEVNDATLDSDADIVTFPWSASKGGIITQYAMNEDGDGVDFTECNHRLMRIDGIVGIINTDRTTPKTLTFANSLKCSSIVSTRYGTLAEAVAKPKTITENVRLNEADIKALDFTKPVYLGKYGRFFAVVSVQWSSKSKTSKVELLLIK